MTIIKTTRIVCNYCSKEMPAGLSENNIYIRDSSISSSHGTTTINGDFCSKVCLIKEIERLFTR